MASGLPPLNALRAFEAAARLGGFVRAAEELHVTPAAISHQVRNLEGHVGEALFVRRPRGLELTEAGRQLLPQLTRGFAHLARGVGALRSGGVAGPLRVFGVPSFATLWLLPRIERFVRAYPEVEVTMDAHWPIEPLRDGKADVGVAYGRGRYPGLVVTPLMRETIFPVCSPSVLNQNRLARFADLRNHTLLHDVDINPDEPAMTWTRWLRDAGVDGVDGERGVKFSNSIMLTEAAVAGLGVALGRTSLVGAHLESGRLVRPLPGERPADYAYYVVTTEADAERARVRAFVDWLFREVERDGLVRGGNVAPDPEV